MTPYILLVVRRLWHRQAMEGCMAAPSLVIQPKKVGAGREGVEGAGGPPSMCTGRAGQPPAPANHVPGPPGRTPHPTAEPPLWQVPSSFSPALRLVGGGMKGRGFPSPGRPAAVGHGVCHAWTNDWPFLGTHILLLSYKKGNCTTDHVTILTTVT